MGKDYYSTLGVDKNVDDKTLKKAYRKLSKKYHPDVNKDNPQAEEKFKEIAEAYDVLSDPQKKQNYDNFGSADGRGGNPFGDGFDVNDIFESFFGGNNNQNPFGRRSRQQKGGDIRVKVKLTLEEVFSGVHKKIKYRRNKSCGECNGSGGDSSRCVTCAGRGVVVGVQNTPFGRIKTNVSCPKCNGNGEIITKSCKSCGTQGVKLNEELVEFDIPKGIMEGEQLIIRGKGNSVKKGINGDLIINIVEVPHELFNRKNIDIHQRIYLTYKELILGTPKEIKTIDGLIRITIKEGTDVGHVLRVPGKGIKRNNQQGDMMVEVWLEIPKELSEEEKVKIEELNI
tara:strand:- start:1113 stop:2135 length:1023 start_codon:yes stop_codon:yes gene_type:complete